MKNKLYLANITLQEKSSKDWRAFVSCRDVEGKWWELRAYGDSAGKAATNAYRRFQQFDAWDCYGYIVPAPADK